MIMNEDKIEGTANKYVLDRIDKSYKSYSEHRQLSASTFSGEDVSEAFVEGAKWALDHQWYKIERDKDGFATEECLDRIFEDSIILFHDNRDGSIQIADGDFDYWRGDIERHTCYDYWMPIPQY